MKNKALFIVGSLSKTGAPQTTLHFIKGILNNFDVDVLVLFADTKQSLERLKEYQDVCRSVRIKTFSSKKIGFNSKNKILILNYVLNLTSKNKYDFVYSFIGKISGSIFKTIKQVNSNCHTVFYSLGPGSIKSTNKKLSSIIDSKIENRKLCKFSDYIFFISKNCLNKKMVNSNAKKINLIDYPTISDSGKSRFKRSKNLGILGTICENKNQIFALKILSKLVLIDSDYCLHIMGNIQNEIYKMKIQKFIMRKNLLKNVHFYDSSYDKNVFFEKISLLLIPSFREGLPLVSLESQYKGVPVLASSAVPFEANLGGLTITKMKVQKWVKYILRNNDNSLNSFRTRDLKLDFNNTLLNFIDKEVKKW